MTNVGDQAAFAGGGYIESGGQAVTVTDKQWRIAAVADFDNDGHPDLAWQHADGSINVWGLNGRALVKQQSIGQVGGDWRIRAVGNYVGDAQVDVLFQSASTGALFLWYKSGLTFLPYGYLSVSPSADWVASGPR
jgi:hypothetical protein